MKNFFKENRKRLLNKIENDSLVLLFAGQSPIKRGDERYPFAPDRNFYYLTGLDDEKLILMLSKINDENADNLFIERFDEVKAKWVGSVIRKNEAEEKTDIPDINYLDEFEEILSSIIFNKRIKYIYLDLENRYFNGSTPAFEFAKKIKENYPYLIIKDIHPIIAEMRTVKDKKEIEKIKKAIDITCDGIREMMKNARSGMYEYEIEAYFDFVLKKNGIRDKAFNSIAASGKNATILHYMDNKDKTGDNDLILFDVGAMYQYYNGDITRTFPVSGKFTERQKQIYNIVLEGQKLIIDTIRPNIEFKSLNEKLKSFYAIKLKEIGLIKSDDEVSKYYYHGVSHLLGLETHDVGRHNEGLLKEGMVLTVEPGLYIAEESIGIRIEDDVVVTKDGCEVLSKDMIKTVEDIEKFMQ